MKIALTDREADVMQVLWNQGPSVVNDVQKHLSDRLAYTTVLTVLRTLEAKGYVERQDNPKDRRSPLLFCTERGRALARRVSAQRREFHKSMTDLLPPEQVAAVDEAMLVLARRCIDGLEAEAAKPKRRGAG